jgi:hypothetical protein
MDCWCGAAEFDRRVQRCRELQFDPQCLRKRDIWMLHSVARRCRTTCRRQAIGRALMEPAARVARNAGAKYLHVIGDTHAERFHGGMRI